MIKKIIMCSWIRYDCSAITHHERDTNFSPTTPSNIIKFTLSLLLLIFIPISCTANPVEEMLEDPKVQEFFDNPDRTYDFYNDYIKKYYPKVNVITYQIFLTMSPQEVEVALQNVVDIFVYEPWFYFGDDPKRFKIRRYWEYVVDQLSFFHDFISKAQVDIATQRVSLPETTSDFLWDMPFMSRIPQQQQRQKNTVHLSKYLRSTNKTTVYDFYALSFDYLIKLFNEGILVQSLKQTKHYFSELEYVCERLRGSTFEQEYAENLKTARDLMGLLKVKLNLDEGTAQDDYKNKKFNNGVCF